MGRWKWIQKFTPFGRSPPNARHSNHAVCQSALRKSEPVSFAMMSQLGMGNVKSSCRIPSTPGRGMKSTCPVVSQIPVDRKSTRLNSSHLVISYAVFCLKKKKYHPSHYRQAY